MEVKDTKNVAQLLIQVACERLIVKYAHLIDAGEAERVGDLFAPNGIWEAYRNRRVGQSEIREAFRLRQYNPTRVSRHICTNIAIDVINPREATGLSYFVLFREEWPVRRDFVPFNGPKMVGDYNDHFVLTSEGWRFAHRKVTITFRAPGLLLPGEIEPSKVPDERPPLDLAPSDSEYEVQSRSEDD